MANYLTTDTELTSVADAIRTKGGTQATLTYPTGFVSAINAIPSGSSSHYGINPTNYAQKSQYYNWQVPTKAIVKVENDYVINNFSGVFETDMSGGFWSNLSEVEFNVDNGTVTYIPESFFYGCSKLKYPSVMSTLTYIGRNGFSNVGYYGDVTENANLVLPVIQEIGQNAFQSNTSINTITLGTYGNSNLTTIGVRAFAGCSHVTTINILETPTSIGNNAFQLNNANAVMNVVWSSGAVSGAPWGFTGTINYDYVPAQ